MAKKSLLKQLEETGCLESSALVSSTLIKELEVYGFVNTCKFDLPLVNTLFNMLKDVVNKAPYRQIVMSDYLYQVIEYFDGRQVCTKGNALPIYKSLFINQEKSEYNLEDISIPSLTSNKLYQEIKSRYGKGVVVKDFMITKHKFPSNISAKDGKAMVSADKGEILCVDRYGCVKSIGEDIMAICRYLDTASGTMCYTQYSLDELFTN